MCQQKYLRETERQREGELNGHLWLVYLVVLFLSSASLSPPLSLFLSIPPLSLSPSDTYLHTLHKHPAPSLTTVSHHIRSSCYFRYIVSIDPWDMSTRHMSEFDWVRGPAMCTRVAYHYPCERNNMNRCVTFLLLLLSSFSFSLYLSLTNGYTCTQYLRNSYLRYLRKLRCRKA